MLVLLFIVLFLQGLSVHAQKKCAQKVYRGPDNPMVCVCNSTYCDEFPPLGQLQSGQAAIYTSSQSGKRFDRTTAFFNADGLATEIQFTVDTSKMYQKIIGFGGAFTDAASINFYNLSQNAKQNLVNAYYAPEGIGYTTGRVPMAGTDFSTREYSYDDVDGDMNLTNFALAMEDLSYKIPFIKMAQTLVGSNLKLFSSPWAPPGWMKTNGQMNGSGILKGPIGGEYYQTWANYFVRFFEEYAKQGVNFWGLTVQNEPDKGQLKYEELYYNASMERDFVKLNLGPTLKGNSLTKNLKLMILDTSRDRMPSFPDTVLADPDAAKYVDGIGIHWYADGNVNSSVLDITHANHPDKFMLYTESCHHCCGNGDWMRGDEYAHDIMDDLNHWVSGWTDWNLCLGTTGGPSWVGSQLDAPIIINATNDEFYKQPMYYALGHISKFIVENSVRVQLDTKGITRYITLEAVAFQTPSNQRVLVLNNRNVNVNYSITIKDASMQGQHLTLTLEARSFTTIVWNAPN